MLAKRSEELNCCSNEYAKGISTDGDEVEQGGAPHPAR